MDKVLEKLEGLAGAGMWRSVEAVAALSLGEEDGRGSAELRLFAARAAAELGEGRRAAELLEDLAEEGLGGDRVPRLLLAVHAALEQPQEAAAWGEKIVARTAADHWALGRAYEATGGRKQASRCFMAVLRENELATEALEALCRVGAASADVQAFLAKRRAGIPSWLVQREAALGRAWALAAAGQHREAGQELGSLAAGAAGAAGREWAQRAQAEQRAAAGDELLSEAAAPVDLRWNPRLLYESRGSPRGFLGAARAAGARGDYVRALALAQRAARDAGSDAAFAERAAAAAGHALAGLGRLEEALTAYRKAGRAGLEVAVRTLGRLGRPQEALRVAKAEYRARPQLEAGLSALAEALAMHAGGRGKAREVLLRCLRAGGPRARHVARLAALEEPVARRALLLRAVSGGPSPDPALASLVPERCLAQSWQARLALAAALAAAEEPAQALSHLRAAAALGGDAAQIAAETARAQRALAGEEGPPEGEEEEGGGRLSAPAPPEQPPNPFLL